MIFSAKKRVLRPHDRKPPQLEEAEAIKKILTVKVKKLAAENKQLQQKLETPKSGIYVRQDVYKRQQATLAAFKKQKNAERVKRQVAVDMASPVVKQKLDEIKRMLILDGVMSTNGEGQAMEAQFDGADGEAAPSADFLDELEDLCLQMEELTTAESQIEELQETSKAAATTTNDTRWGWQPGFAAELANPRLAERYPRLGPRDHEQIQKEFWEGAVESTAAKPEAAATISQAIDVLWLHSAKIQSIKQWSSSAVRIHIWSPPRRRVPYRVQSRID